MRRVDQHLKKLEDKLARLKKEYIFIVVQSEEERNALEEKYANCENKVVTLFHLEN